MTEDEMVGWHHQLKGHEFEQAPGDGEGIERPGVLQSIGQQRVRHDRIAMILWVIEGAIHENKDCCNQNEFWGESKTSRYVKVVIPSKSMEMASRQWDHPRPVPMNEV